VRTWQARERLTRYSLAREIRRLHPHYDVKFDLPFTIRTERKHGWKELSQPYSSRGSVYSVYSGQGIRTKEKKMGERDVSIFFHIAFVAVVICYCWVVDGRDKEWDLTEQKCWWRSICKSVANNEPKTPDINKTRSEKKIWCSKQIVCSFGYSDPLLVIALLAVAGRPLVFSGAVQLRKSWNKPQTSPPSSSYVWILGLQYPNEATRTHTESGSHWTPKQRPP